MTTYTAEQIEAIGGRRWSPRDDMLRVYVNADVWAPMIGLEWDTYRTGNISYAAIDGQRISNGRGTRLLATKVYWQDGHIYISRDCEYAGAIRDAIDTAVANLPTSGDDDPPSTASGTVQALRSAGRTVREIAEMVGVSISTIYRWARGYCQPRPANAAALAALA